MSTTSKSIWVVGAGYLGLRLTRLLKDQSHKALAIGRHFFWDTSRSINSPNPDWDDFNGNWDHLCRISPPDILVLAWAPASRSMEAYQECYIDSASQLLNSLIKLKQLPKRIIHISSASTLGGTHGEVIDELDAPLPQRQQSLLLRSAEDNIDHFGRSHNIDVCHLKLAGIYGPNRSPGLRRLNNNTPIEQHPNGWINLIHVDDAVSAAYCAINALATGAFIVSSEAVQRKPFYDVIQNMHRTPVSRWSSSPDPNLGRRLNPNLFKTSFHWQPQFPSALKWMGQQVI